MKKPFKIISLIAAAALSATAFVALPACGSKVELLKENIVDDKYDNYYEIFVYSYCDSNGDGYGDLNGVTSKLDYVRDMGYTGIWLMPINPSTSYHGYDVTDYYGVKNVFGTMNDYENLIKEAHERDIKVIIDLVVNHTSSSHPWFTGALSAFKTGNTSAKYADWYTFKRSNPNTAGYNQKDGVWYESNFDQGMPDLNLKSESLREELDNVIKFWIEKGTDGFRLDGCKHYCTTQEESVEFCTFLNETAQKYNKDAYIVGENWASRTQIEAYYKSGVDSFFNFDAAGNVSAAINMNSAAELWKSIRNGEKTAGEYIPAPFLSNHDNGMGRIAGRMAREEDKVKFAYGLISLYAGNVFTYYGDEIGMVAKRPTVDQDLRIGMYWDDVTPLTKNPPGASEEKEFLFGSVEKQQKDGKSILNYYKLCNNARNAFPALMRGKSERVETGDESVLVFKRTYNGQTVTVAVNLATDKRTVAAEGSLAQQICVKGSISQKGGSLVMPAYSIAILT